MGRDSFLFSRNGCRTVMEPQRPTVIFCNRGAPFTSKDHIHGGRRSVKAACDTPTAPGTRAVCHRPRARLRGWVIQRRRQGCAMPSSVRLQPPAATDNCIAALLLPRVLFATASLKDSSVRRRCSCSRVTRCSSTHASSKTARGQGARRQRDSYWRVLPSGWPSRRSH